MDQADPPWMHVGSVLYCNEKELSDKTLTMVCRLHRIVLDISVSEIIERGPLMRLDNNFKVFIWYGIVFEIMTKMYDPFLIKFLERIGGDSLSFTLFNSIPGFVTVFALIPGALLIRRFNKQWVTAALIAASRLCLLLLILVPMLPKEVQPLAFIIFFAIMQFPNSIYQSSYTSFIGDIFDVSERANAIGKRNAYTVPLIIVTTIGSGWALGNLAQVESSRLTLYQLFFFIAFIWGVIEVYLFTRFKYEHVPVSGKIDFKKIIYHLGHHRPLKTFFICSLIFHFGWQMGWPLFNIYLLKYLHADEQWLSIINVVTYVVMFFGYTFWARIIEKKGNAYVCGISTMGMALTPILYVLSPDLLTLTMVSVIMGVFMAGTLSVLLSSLLEVCPEEDRLIYVAIYNTLISVSLAIAPLIGHAIYEATDIVFAMLVVAFFRALGSLAFFIRDRNKTRKWKHDIETESGY